MLACHPPSILLHHVLKVWLQHWLMIMDSTQSVSQSNDHLSASLETFLEECRFFTAPWDKDKESEDSEAEADPEEVKQEVQGLHEEQENPDSAVPE